MLTEKKTKAKQHVTFSDKTIMQYNHPKCLFFKCGFSSLVH